MFSHHAKTNSRDFQITPVLRAKTLRRISADGTANRINKATILNFSGVECIDTVRSKWPLRDQSLCVSL